MLYPPSFKLLNLKSYFSSLIVISFPFINFSLSLSFSTRVIKSAYANPSLSYILYTSLNPGLDIFIISSDNFITGSLSISTILYTPPKQGLDLLTAISSPTPYVSAHTPCSLNDLISSSFNELVRNIFAFVSPASSNIALHFLER